MDEKEKSFLDIITSPLTGDYRKNKPISVKAADVAVDMTPVGSAVEIGEELSKEDPNYAKIGVIAAGDVLGAAIPAMGPVSKSLIKQSDKIADLKDVPTVEAAGLTDEAIEKWRKENATSEEFRKKLKGRNEELQELASGVEEGRVFTSTYRDLADELRPIRVVEEVPKPATFVEAVSALNAGKRKLPMVGLNRSIPDGDIVDARLDIDAYTDYDVWIPTLKHSGKTMYKPAVVLEDVKFIQPDGPQPRKALGVAKGKGKAPFAVMTGKYVEATDDEAYKLAQDVFDNPEFTQVGYDPTRRGFFYDRETGEAIVEADTVVQVGHLVLAHNAKKMDAEAFPFSEGGMAIEEQMAMNFGDVPDNTIGIDPVSGNEIPMGSTAENVRDDIPANLSEGEIVVPADVVNFHGVKLFEDLRAEAKIGYQDMAQDGRMGGEPMDDDMGMDIELSELDLEVMDDEAPVQMNRGGRSMADYKDVAKNRDIKAPKRTAPRKTHAEIMASVRGNDNNSSSSSSRDNSPTAISARVQARKNEPKNRFEAIRNRLRDVFKDDDRRVQLTQQPRTSDDIGPSIANQINFGGKGFDFRNNQSSTNQPPKTTPFTTGARGVPSRDDEPLNVRYYDQPFYKRLMEGLGFDEGGLVPDEDTNLIGGEAQFNQPFYAPDQKGGFDMENAYVDQVEGGTGGPVLEMREYMNDEGHRIFITFIDGVAQMEIPAGYYPVGEGVAVAPTPAVGGSGGSDSGGGMNMPTPDPVNYKELSLEELTDMVNSQGDLKGDVIATGLGLLNPLMGAAVKFAMWNQTRQVKREIERRLTSNETSNVDKMRYQNLLEITERETPTLLDKILGKDFEKTVGQIPKPVTPDTDFADPTMAGGQPYTPGAGSVYTPNDQTASQTTTPGVDDGLSNEIKTQIEQASADAASAAFGSPSKTVKPVGNDDFIESVKQDPDSFLPPTSTNDSNDSPISRPPTPAPKPSPIYDNVAAGDYDDDSTGVYKGGMMRKKKKKKSK